jgi:hypothetical protein
MKGRFVFLCLLIVSWTSCKKGHRCDCFKRTGKDVVSDRPLAAFKEIALEDNINLVLTQGTEERIRIEGGEGIMDGIESIVTDSVLTIRNTNRCNLSRSLKRPITAYLSFKSITRIFFNGSGNISSTNTISDSLLQVDTQNGAGKVNLDLDVTVLIVALSTGPSDITLSGKTRDSFVYNAGNGFVHMEEMKSKYVSVISISTGDCYVWATDLLDVTLKYNGNIYYKGSPQVRDPALTGKGKLIAL